MQGDEEQVVDLEGQMEKKQHSVYLPENYLHGIQKQIIVLYGQVLVLVIILCRHLLFA